MSSIHWTFPTHQVSATRPQRHSLGRWRKVLRRILHCWSGYLVGAALVMDSHNVLGPEARPVFKVGWTGLIWW